MRVNSTLYFILKDHLGSASVVTDSTGATVGEDRFYPFGETRFTTGSMQTDKLFTGQREITGLGIYYYGARFYSPKLGRFLSADTVVQNFANPQALSRYSYVLNNPIRYNDPTGHRACDNYDAAGRCITAPGGGGSGFGGVPKPKKRPGDNNNNGGGTDTNGNGVPDVPDPNAVVPQPSGTCQYDNLVECLYSGGFWPSGDYTFTNEEWNQFTLALYYDIHRRASTGEGFWTLQFNPTGRKWPFVPFHTEEYYEREVYDTPFWDASGAYSGKVCFENGECQDRTDVNYIAQGIWSGAANEGKWGAEYAANYWKQEEYGHDASPEVLYWVDVGVDTFYQYDKYP